MSNPMFDALKKIAEEFGADEVSLTTTNNRTKEMQVYRYEHSKNRTKLTKWSLRENEH